MNCILLQNEKKINYYIIGSFHLFLEQFPNGKTSKEEISCTRLL
jgi:hypothetical protein